MREVLTGLAERRLGGSWRPASPRSRWWWRNWVRTS